MPPQERTFVPVADPTQRPHRVRATVRVLLLDPRNRVLLFEDSDPGTGDRWWILPGGGIEEGESPLDTVVREIEEETGQLLGRETVLGPLAHRHVVHGYSDQVVDQDDTFYAARVPVFEVSTAGHTREELITMKRYAWWTRAQLRATGEEIWPSILTDLWDLVDEQGRWPLTLPEVEESSVAVTARP